MIDHVPARSHDGQVRLVEDVTEGLGKVLLIR
jgi:hypothetical protein